MSQKELDEFNDDNEDTTAGKTQEFFVDSNRWATKVVLRQLKRIAATKPDVGQQGSVPKQENQRMVLK